MNRATHATCSKRKQHNVHVARGAAARELEARAHAIRAAHAKRNPPK